jgi:hypothetical protein
MRAGALSFVAMTLFAMYLCGCGYMGEPLPPALNRPERVQDIAALQRGSNIHVQFTIPQVTTENLPLKKGSRDIELRIGPPPTGTFSMEAWLRTADRVPMVDDDKPTAYVTYPAAKFYNKTVFVAVNVHGPSGGRSVGWSKIVVVHVVPELPTPQALELSDTADAVHLEWHAGAPEFRVFRRAVPELDWMQLATSAKPSYTDNTIEYGKTYEYEVQSIEKTEDTYAESELSDVKTIKPVDKFPPAVPNGVAAVPGTRSIELVWNRNTEKDFASYNVFRDGMKIADGLTAPAFSDRGVQPKVKVQYQVSAVDTAGNESARSAAVEATIP